ncbi:MAG: tyrosine-type recombinase/integrase [Lachnospiraceae bacterium]
MARTKKHNGNFRKTISYNGKRYDVYGKTEQELFENVAKKKAELERGYEKVYNPSLYEYYAHFDEVRSREIKESTLRAQRCQFNNIAAVELAKGVVFGNMKIKDITRRDIETARQKLLDNGKTPQNLNNCFSHLNHVFQSAVLDDTIVKNPCRALKQLKRDIPPIGENKHRALSETETGKFFQVAKEKNSFYYYDFLMMVKTGLRVGELTALYPTDIDAKNGFIHVRRTISRTETGAYVVGENAKTKSGIRDIPLTDDVKEIVRKQEKFNTDFFGLERSGLLFRSMDGKILREYCLNREIKRLCKAAGIEPFTCHAFRNTFATRFIEQRPQDYKILSEILGHKDISITLNLYTHVMTENKVKAMNDIIIRVS